MNDDRERWQRLQDIVQSALDRPADERAAFLAEACGGDDDLRREATSLLAQDDRASDFLAMPVGELAANAVTYSPGTSPAASDSRNLVGSRLGVYEIRARIGAGGMGEVYRAHDHSLHRDVAIKVLPSAFVNDPERLARFEREARLLASLNHPHIGAVFGLAGDGDVRGIVLDLIEGDTLETRLKQGPIPVAQALAFAVQITGALDHAHQRGVMHRDLKPANIMLTRGGAKLLDFGLAKWGRPRSGYVSTSGSSAARPEGVESVTSEGTILGTLHYMAPEQLEGKKVDSRADVFSFGAVLYEMLIGKRAFDGGSTAAVMAAVLNTEPTELHSLQRLSSPALERVIRKCLAKDPDDRWQTARDLADELRWITAEIARPSPAMPNLGVRRRGFGQWAVPGAVAVGLVLAAWAGWRIGSADLPAARAVVHFSALPSTGRINRFDISGDGTKLVYSSGGRLYLRQFDQSGDAPIQGTEGAGSPLFSPDGEWVAFFSQEQERLMKVNVKTVGAPVLICGGLVDGFLGADWLENGSIIFATRNHGVQRVFAEGGEPATVVALSESTPEFDHHSPSMLPGGEAVLFTSHERNGQFNVAVQNLATSERKVIIKRAYEARFVPPGHLVFAREGTLFAVPFDPGRLEVTGPEVNLLENVLGDEIDGVSAYRLSNSGTLAFRPAPSNAGRTLVWVDRKGIETPVNITARAISTPSVSPDGRRLAFAVAEGGRRDIWTYELATEKLARVTREGNNWAPIWTRDGQRLAFTSTRGGSRELFWQSSDGGSAADRLVGGDLQLSPGGWSADGKVLVYSDGGTGPQGASMFLVSTDDARQPRPLLHGPGEQWSPRMSPDGRWIAYASNEATRAEVFVSGFPAFTSRYQVTSEGGDEPEWSSDGRELWYWRGGQVFSVAIDAARAFTSAKPREWFSGPYVFGSYDVAPDGRLLMIKRDPEETASLGLRVVVNWVDQLARRVPNGR